MNFTTDKQTLEDLKILGKYSANSIFSVFNCVVTPGGEKLLDKLFHDPLDKPEIINRRSRLFRFFQIGNYTFPIGRADFLLAERYLSQPDFSNPVTSFLNMLRLYSLSRIGVGKEFKMVKEGFLATVKTLHNLKKFSEEIKNSTGNNLYKSECTYIDRILSDRRLSWISEKRNRTTFSLLEFARYGYIIRHSLKEEMKKLLHTIYDIDVNIAVAKVAGERGFCYADAEDKGKNILLFEGLFHPGIKNAVPNDLVFEKDKNVIFLTGANMAGKSTLMKALGTAVYLAHMGFPVPASKMKFSVKEGMFTSINVPDNLNEGLSHFYAEVLRVKAVAREVSSGKHLLVIFDELFKGTNVKDAYDATVAITDAFAKKPNSSFVVSTHIMEAGEMLKEMNDNIKFLYLPTIMQGMIPHYTRKLKDGITDDRHGMVIIRNEKIVEIINGTP